MPGLKIDERFCMGCHACEVACKQEHGLPEGPRMIRVDPAVLAPGAAAPVGAVVPPGADGFTRRLWHVSVCLHCDGAACVEACPERALEQEGGVVRVAVDLCTGCRLCADACPSDAPQFHPQSGVAQRASGGRPACTTARRGH
jgi:molybdopterin-containing oxidoreductase family iron-sulfur binding subunit